MKGTIQLEIEHVKYKDFVEFDNLIDKRMVLAPIKEDQDRAILRFFYEKESYRKLIHEEAITLVPFKKNTEILLTGTPKSSRRVDCTVQVDDGKVQHFSLKKPVNVAALVLGLAAVAALALIGIFAVPALVKNINAAAERRALAAQNESATVPPDNGSGTETASAGAGTEETAPVVNAEKTSAELTVYFLGESAVLRSSEKKKLDSLSRKVKDHEIIACMIDGHTADYHSKESQLEVSENRVISVKQYLKSLLGSSLPAVQGIYFGASQNVSTGKVDEYLDRRAEIVIEYYK